MTGQVDGEHIPAVIAEIAALQAEPGMVESRTMHEHHGALRRIELVVGGVGEDRFAGDFELHFWESLSERSRSSIRSCASSRPIDRRTVPAVMPAFFRSSSLMR